MKRRSGKKFSLLALLFLVLSAPLAVYSIVNLTSFDTRNKAADLTLDVETCRIKFPFVNPSTIQLNTTVQSQVSAYTPGEAITQVTVMDRQGNYIVKKDYDTGVDKVSENFTLTPKEAGDLGILGTLTTDKGTRPCVIQSNRSVSVVEQNNAPEFKTLPTSAKPSNVIKVNEGYEYKLEALDSENDNINYAFSFTPDTTWLKSSVIENGAGGKLTIKFSGTPDKPGSYLANIFIHDGYNAHLRAQTWVINVDQDKNDTPKVTIIKPSAEMKISKGEKVTISWEGADLNKIVRYELYVATNPGNANSWIAINKNISTKVGSYIFDTKDIPNDTYQFIVRAVDNFNPPGIGSAVSPKVTIGTPNTDGPDDGVVLQEAQVVNISPSNESSIKNKNAIISATLIPSKEATVLKESIKIEFDDQDITSKTRITQGSDNSFVLSYTPEKEHTEGSHKVTVYFEDSKGNKVTKSWTFTVIPEVQEDKDSFNIFGFNIPKRIVWIVGAGLAILLLALIVPWLLYLAWRGTKDEEFEITYNNTTPIKPDNTPVTFVDNRKEIEKIEKKVEEVEKKIIEEEKPKEILKAPVFTFNKIENVNDEKPKVEIIEPIPEPVIANASINPVIPVNPQPIVTQEPMTPPVIPQEPVSQPTVTQVEPPREEVEDDILANTNKELEELAKKLKEKEEMLSEFMPTQDSDTAPSSAPSVTSTPPIAS